VSRPTIWSAPVVDPVAIVVGVWPWDGRPDAVSLPSLERQSSGGEVTEAVTGYTLGTATRGSAPWLPCPEPEANIYGATYLGDA